MLLRYATLEDQLFSHENVRTSFLVFTSLSVGNARVIYIVQSLYMHVHFRNRIFRDIY